MGGFNGEAVKELSERVLKPVQLGDVVVTPPNWTSRHVHELAKPAPAFPAPKAAPLHVATLGALRDYLKENRDGLDLAKIMVHVETPHRVSVGSVLREPARDREIYLTATAIDMTEGFVGKFHSAEDFNIGLMVRFVEPVVGDQLNQRNELIQLVSSVKTEQSTDVIDTGLSQSLEARAGVVMKSHQQLPNPVTLVPFRTFRDILQPSSLFVLRAKADAGKLPELCLFEADGGSWRLTAIDRVRDWLEHELPPEIAVLA
jgi:hypothetical protein